MGRDSAAQIDDRVLTPEPQRFEGARDAFGALARVLGSASVLVRAYRGGVPPARREAVMVAVSRSNTCRGCSNVHHRWALRAGVSAEDLRSIGLGDLAALDVATRSAVVYATDRAARRFRSAADPQLTANARSRLGEAQLEQVDAVAGLIAFANLTMNTVTGALRTSRPQPRPTSAHPLFAKVWRILSSKAMSHEARSQLLAGLEGTVVELGAGDGLNFRHYPSTVNRVVAIEPEPQLRSLAQQAARGLPVPTTVVDGAAEAIPGADDSYDAAVICLVLCTVPDQAQALAEIKRVLRPGGELRFYEHVAAGDRRRPIQRWLDTSGIWPRLGAGCHLSRDTLRAIRGAGFIIEEYCELESGLGRLSLPHIAGVARLPLSTP